MALNGTIGDFGLGDIFQLIGIQRKTGILTLESDDEVVTVKFLEGHVVEADTGSEGLEDRLGAVLVRTGKITEVQLEEALKVQKRTLQRLGHILVRHDYITQEELVEALRVQSLQIIYRLFRWRSGKYSMQMVSNLDYDEQHVTPIASETVLMEGARMIDEWPMIERRIRSDAMVFEKTEAAEQLNLEVESLVDRDIDFDNLFEQAEELLPDDAAGDSAIELSPEERRVLSLVDGRLSVQEITDRVNLGEFDTQRILCELLTRDLIREVPEEEPEESAGPSRGARLVQGIGVSFVGLILLLAATASLATLPQNRFNPWRVTAGPQTTDRLRFFASHARLDRLEQAIQVHYLVDGRIPGDLDQLAARGYVAPEDLQDPWGRPYGYNVSAGGFQVFGLDAEGQPNAGLSRTHRFSPTQRMILEAAP